MIAEEIYAEDLAEDATTFDDYDEAICSVYGGTRPGHHVGRNVGK